MLQIGIREPGSAITHFSYDDGNICHIAVVSQGCAEWKSYNDSGNGRVYGKHGAALWCKYGVPFACCPG